MSDETPPDSAEWLALVDELSEATRAVEEARAWVRRIVQHYAADPYWTGKLPEWADLAADAPAGDDESPSVEDSAGPDMEDAIVRLRELLNEARGIAWGQHRGRTQLWGSSSLPYPEWLTSEDLPHWTFVQVEGVNNAPVGSALCRALWQRDEARLWAHGAEHRMWPFHTDVMPLWLSARSLPADPEIVRNWQRAHPERRVEY